MAEAAGQPDHHQATQNEKLVIAASSLGTVFEWYDFYLYGLLATIISAKFFSGVNETTGFIFALAAFAAGFAVRPFGALVFGRIGDLVGRKNTFLVTMAIMGLSTFTVGLLPSYASIGVAAPVILVVLRLAQGLALGGEYGGAATYVAEHAPNNKRGLYTSWIQTTATLGLFAALLVVIGTRWLIGEAAFADWGWRVPFLISIVLLGVSLWIRLQLNESPVFQKMKDEGTTSKAPLTEAFGRWSNLRLVLIALFGAVVGQAVVWYTGQFYALFFLEKTLKVDGWTTNILIAIALAIGTPFFVFFGWLSDRIGRTPIILAGFGGVQAEILKDVRLLPTDLTREAIIAELHALKSGALLQGFRGSPAMDVGAVADIVLALGAVLEAGPAIREIDLNPVVVYPWGSCRARPSGWCCRASVRGTSAAGPGLPARARQSPCVHRAGAAPATGLMYRSSGPDPWAMAGSTANRRWRATREYGCRRGSDSRRRRAPA